ncbi:MAG: hypothetical protein JRI25_12400 [Deltaproteobacteria bacterium]|nr:hypothetical protein [Deltaproteobacteria bacterium]MBW2255381.1 hypothetical protein [Deltaproteobacteria bacterium]
MNLPPFQEMLPSLGADLLDDAGGALFISVAILLLFVGAEVASRVLSLRVEFTRKLTHVGAGAVVLGMPWLLEHTVTVVVLSLAFAGILVGGRVTGLLGSIHNVERRTGGAYYYPFAVLGAWILSGGDALLYCVPLAVMAVADTGAALVGQRTGETTYKVMDGERTLEGSVAFFVLAFGVTLAGCAIAGRPGWPDMLLITLVVAGLTTAAEAVSIRGSDNLAIPYAAWLSLERTERLGLESLGDWIVGMALAVTVLVVTGERAKLTAAGAMVVFMVCTLSYALGGWVWFVPLAVLYALYLFVRRPEDPTELDMVFPTTAGSMIVVLIYAHTDAPSLYLAYLTTVAANGAMAGALLAKRRGWLLVPAVLAGAMLPVASAVVFVPQTSLLLPVAGGLCAPLLYVLLSRVGVVGRRPVASLMCGLAIWWLPF